MSRTGEFIAARDILANPGFQHRESSSFSHESDASAISSVLNSLEVKSNPFDVPVAINTFLTGGSDICPGRYFRPEPIIRGGVVVFGVRGARCFYAAKSGNEGTSDNSEMLIRGEPLYDSTGSASPVVMQLLTRREQASVNSSKVSLASETMAALRSYCAAGDIDSAVDRCFEMIENWFAQNDLPLVDETLSYAEPEYLDSRVIIGMLRATFRAREKLYYWHLLLQKERRRIKREGRDDLRMLRGLLEANGETDTIFAIRSIT